MLSRLSGFGSLLLACLYLGLLLGYVLWLEVGLNIKRDVPVTEERRETEANVGHRLIVRSSSDGRIGQSLVPIVVRGTIEAVTRGDQHHLLAVVVDAACVNPITLGHVRRHGRGLEGEHDLPLGFDIRGVALGINSSSDLNIIIGMDVTATLFLHRIDRLLGSSCILNEFFRIGRSNELSAQGSCGQLKELLASPANGDLDAMEGELQGVFAFLAFASGGPRGWLAR
jgi:hypothetical protein